MALLVGLRGITGLCVGGLDLGSSCSQRLLIDAINLSFLLICSLSLLVASLAKNHSDGRRARNWVFLVVSFFCAATGMAYIAFYSWDALGKDQGFLQWGSLVLLVRGIVWISISVSFSFFRTSTWMQALVSAWWISFSLCISALNLKILMEDHALQILEAVAWPVNLMLLFCGFMLVHRLLCHDPTCHGITEPLLVEEEEEGGRRRTGLGTAGLMSKMVFSWLSPLLRLGHSKPLTLDDIPRLDPEDGASLAYQAFAQAWELQRKDGSKVTNLALFALGRCHAKGMLLVGLYALLRTLSVVAAPVLLYAFVQYSNREEQDLRQGLLLVGCFVVTKVVESLSQRHWFFNARRLGMRMRSSLMAAVFQKQLRLSSLGRGKHSTGEIVNYIAVDAYRLGEFPWWFHMAWTSPLQLVLAVVILFGAAGSGAAFGLIPLAICGVLNVPFAKILQNCQYRFMVAQDERLRATSEILNSMKIVKLQSWEEHFRKIIEFLRDEEFKWLRESQMKKSYGTALYWMSPTIVSAVTFAGCAIMRSAPLNASTIFTVLAALRVMSEPVRMIPEILSVMIQVKVSLDRLDVFLLEDEIREDVARRSEPHNSDLPIEIRNGAFSWVDVDASNPTLEDIDLEIYGGQKTAVCGPVGAGKSSILYAILGEIPRVAGSVNVHGSIAYVSQTSWIQSGTIQENILYGKEMNMKAYDMAIRACALDKDIENFSHGDLTEIGQRGLNLSGGQKQRIQLARAVYSDADIYLLDDPFSAVDAQTAAVLFNDCVMSALAKKTVILVTHQIEFLPEMNRILVVDGGQIIQSGSYEELLKSGTEFEKLVDAHQSAFTAVDPANHHSQEEAPMIVEDLYGVKQNSEVDISAKDSSKVQLTEDEEKEIGYRGWKPYLDYIRVSRSALHLSGVILSQVAFVVLQLLSTYWLAVAVEIPHMGRGILLGTYTIISVLSCFFAYTRSWVATHMGLRASKAFFSGFIVSVFKAPMLFFDSTPVGRILTRASSDMSVLDYDIPFSIAFALAASVEVAATIAVVAIVTWQVLVVAVPVMIAMIYVQRYYLASARELVRINGTTKAPVMNYAAETSLGVVTIRAFAGVERFIRNNLKIIDTDAMLFFHTVATLEWILVRVEALQNITVLAATLLLVLLPPDTVAPGFVGLSLSYALNLSSAQTFLTRWYSSLDNYIISAERIEQFMHLPSEAPAIIDHVRPPSLWPYEGRIDLQDLKIKYRPNAPLVLKGISCTFAAGERVGVVGRTGSGKTTLISALFRLVEPAEGRILIDSLDICSIGLKDLRMKLSIIPQEPTLFRGSVRSNLDPLGQYSDQEIWEALEKCQLKTTISSLPNLLDSSVSDEGENWSVGQRQLFCLGRVLLRRNRILVLDEATASIDSATDVVLQRIIRQEFSSCTVITVAHRVPTVMDSDMVMVLSYGKLVEYDKPSNLMGITSSYFSKLVAEYWSNCKRKSTQNLMSF